MNSLQVPVSLEKKKDVKKIVGNVKIKNVLTYAFIQVVPQIENVISKLAIVNLLAYLDLKYYKSPILLILLLYFSDNLNKENNN